MSSLRARLLCALAALALLPACPGAGTDDDDLDDFSETLSADLEDLARRVEELSAAAAELPDDAIGRATETVCQTLLGACEICYEVDGGPFAGTFTAGVSDLPCSASAAARGVGATYTVTAAALTGDWDTAGAIGDYAITMTGSMASTLEVAGRRNTTSLNSSWTLSSLTAQTSANAVESWELALSYSAFGGHTYTVTGSGAAGSFTGTATRDDAVSCTISGSVAAPTVACGE